MVKVDSDRPLTLLRSSSWYLARRIQRVHDEDEHLPRLPNPSPTWLCAAGQPDVLVGWRWPYMELLKQLQ